MKLVVEKPEEKPVHVVTLNQDGDGVAVNVGGWYVLKIRDDGCLYRYMGVSRSLGLQIDDLGRIIIKEFQ